MKNFKSDITLLVQPGFEASRLMPFAVPMYTGRRRFQMIDCALLRVFVPLSPGTSIPILADLDSTFRPPSTSCGESDPISDFPERFECLDRGSLRGLCG